MERDLPVARQFFMSGAHSQVNDPGSHPVANQKSFLTPFYVAWPAHCTVLIGRVSGC